MLPLASTEIIDIRRFKSADFQPLLEAESRVWSETLRWDYGPASRLVTTCLDEKRLSGYALVSEGRIEGYSFFFYEGEKGLIGDLFATPDGLAGERARLLLDHVLETLLATPGLRRVEAQLPHFSLEELVPCFRAHGFEGYLRRFMIAPLATWGAPDQGGSGSASAPDNMLEGELRLASDFLTEPWERRHDRQVAQLIYHTYRHHVDGFINDQYKSAEGAARLIETITHLGGCGECLPDESFVAFHRGTRKMAAVLALTAVRPRTAHIPQVAVAREFQGVGLGTLLMEKAFARLASKKFEEVSLTVTDLNAGAVRLYERLGFTTFRSFGAFVWNGRDG